VESWRDVLSRARKRRARLLTRVLRHHLSGSNGVARFTFSDLAFWVQFWATRLLSFILHHFTRPDNTHLISYASWSTDFADEGFAAWAAESGSVRCAHSSPATARANTAGPAEPEGDARRASFKELSQLGRITNPAMAIKRPL
jgi:hypothetical protein